MPAASSARVMRRLTSSMAGVCSIGAKKTPETRRSTYCWQSAQARSSREAPAAVPPPQSRACWPASGEAMIPWQIGSKTSVWPRSGMSRPKERAPWRRAGPDEGARAGAPVDQPGQLEVAHGAPDGDARGAEARAELDLAREPVARPPAPGPHLPLRGRPGPAGAWGSCRLAVAHLMGCYNN